jgi:hypothetical protein
VSPPNAEIFRAALEPVEVIDAGNDTVVAYLRGQMHGRASGAGVPWAFWQRRGLEP